MEWRPAWWGEPSKLELKEAVMKAWTGLFWEDVLAVVAGAEAPAAGVWNRVEQELSGERGWRKRWGGHLGGRWGSGLGLMGARCLEPLGRPLKGWCRGSRHWGRT